MTGIFVHELFEKHLDGYNHPERPERYRALIDRLERFPEPGRLRFIEAIPAEIAWLERVHDREYIDGILSLDVRDAVVLDWGDTVATPATPPAALFAAGAVVHASRMVLAGEIASAFCPVRPPGHHAERDRAMGFCIFNNVAVAAEWLLAEGGLSRVAIVDWDVHHGNGTERQFAEDRRVFYASLHQYRHFPGTGSASMRGTGQGAGFTLNVPMGAGADDTAYREVFDGRVLPALEIFDPEFILISAGFDAHRDDPLASASVSSAIFGWLTRRLRETADRHCGGRIVSVLEGGYDLDALAESVEAHLLALVNGVDGPEGT
ncbi:MAG: histone deacetylase [Candidatus Krumholzibacteriota bacterium]|nr:histone deacetylase [Candidatus Krumholzibacteriota bacterium]